MLSILQEIISKFNLDHDPKIMSKSVLEHLAGVLKTESLFLLKHHPSQTDNEDDDYYAELSSYHSQLDEINCDQLNIAPFFLTQWSQSEPRPTGFKLNLTILNSSQQEMLSQLGIQTLYLIPLAVGQVVWGLLVLGDHHADREWSNDELLLSWHVLSNLSSYYLKLDYLQTIEDETTKADQAYEICANALTRSSEFATMAEKSSLAMRDFLAHTSHEIRTPLNAILGMTELVLDTELTSEQNDYLNKSLLAARNLLGLINDILDLTKIDAGKIILEHIVFSTKNIIESCAEIMVNIATEKNLELICRISPQVPAYIVGDPNRLKQIIINLLGNAIKFTETGYVALTVDVISVSNDGVMLHFVISDTGIGIPKDKQDLIFDSFVQADQSTTRQFGGSGLGLTITKKLIELMSGQLTVESKENQGSKFAFYLSFVLPANQSIAPTDDKKNLVGVNILIAESNDINQKVLANWLADWGATIFQVPNRSEIVPTLKANQTDQSSINIIIVNPEIYGNDAFKNIQQLNELIDPAKTHIILSTNPRFSRDHLNNFIPIISGWLIKPIIVEQLYQTMLKALKRQFTEEVGNHAPILLNTPPLTILVAEDNKINLHLLTVILEKKGHHVTGVHDGEQVIEIIKEQSFDLIFMDVQMPVLDGLEATRLIRISEQATEQHIPIIAMTANAFQEDRKECLDAGMDDFLTKPIEKDKLLAILNHIADQVMKQNVPD